MKKHEANEETSDTNTNHGDADYHDGYAWGAEWIEDLRDRLGDRSWKFWRGVAEGVADNWSD